MGTIEDTVNTMEKQRKFQLNREKSYGENKCSVMTEWRMRQRPCGREDLTSLNLGRNIKVVSSVVKMVEQRESKTAKPSTS